MLHARIARHRSSAVGDIGGSTRDRRWWERAKSRAATAITSRLSPLSDNNIRAAIEGFSRLREVLHLHDQARRGASNLVRLNGRTPCRRTGRWRPAPRLEFPRQPRLVAVLCRRWNQAPPVGD